MPLPDWPHAPAHPRITSAAVDIFRFSLDLPAGRMADLRGLLTAEEQARAERIIIDSIRQRWAAARGQVRAVLGSCLGADPASLRFTLNPYGKPEVVGGGDAHFNVSHSGGLGLLAITRGAALGVDVEHIHARVDFANVARRFFAPGEAQALLALPESEQLRAFYACWTRKEAYVKARGMGFSLPLDSFEVSLTPGEPARLVQPEEPWSMVEIGLGEEYAAALVVEGVMGEINTWEWAG